MEIKHGEVVQLVKENEQKIEYMVGIIAQAEGWNEKWKASNANGL